MISVNGKCVVISSNGKWMTDWLDFNVIDVEDGLTCDAGAPLVFVGKNKDRMISSIFKLGLRDGSDFRHCVGPEIEWVEYGTLIEAAGVADKINKLRNSSKQNKPYKLYVNPEIRGDRFFVPVVKD